MDDLCPFCDLTKIQNLVYEDELVYVALSKNPINKYHLMVIPKQHYKDLIDIPDDLLLSLFKLTKKYSKKLRQTYEVDAVQHITDDQISNDKIYNLVPHFKIHIIPRFNDDGIETNWNRYNLNDKERKMIELTLK